MDKIDFRKNSGIADISNLFFFSYTDRWDDKRFWEILIVRARGGADQNSKESEEGRILDDF